jgi:hypothetical protein
MMPFGQRVVGTRPSLPRKRSSEGTPTSEQYVWLGSYRSITGKPRTSLARKGTRTYWRVGCKSPALFCTSALPELRRIHLPRTRVNEGKKKGRSPVEVGISAKTHLGELHPLAVVSHYVLAVDCREIPASATTDDIAYPCLLGVTVDVEASASVRSHPNVTIGATSLRGSNALQADGVSAGCQVDVLASPRRTILYSGSKTARSSSGESKVSSRPSSLPSRVIAGGSTWVRANASSRPKTDLGLSSSSTLP